MNQYNVEGVFANKQGVKKARKTGVLPLSSIEPFAKMIWANSPDEAIRLATLELDGGEWTEGPRVSRMSEEQRMRAIGAPQLPGFGAPAKKKRK
jgi:hypothetical protein